MKSTVSKSDSPGCSNLRNVRYYDTQLYLSMEGFWENIKYLLSRLCGVRIRRIHVALGVWSLEDTHQFLSRKIGRDNLNEQESINELMLSPRFNALEHFEFEIYVILPSSINKDADSARQLYLSIAGCIQRLFCIWYQRGIVTVMLDRKIYNAPAIKKAHAKQKMEHVEVPQPTKPVLLLEYRPASHVPQRTEKEDPSVSAYNDINDELSRRMHAQ
ncbi:hypothetical protein WOLCODRAFT_164777 [Wolfiporia cocos MD-104 SS10]|uniref:Uncharacterized protein n=1 Tax=Wolfiporia cocos (strain MD-104) TaxID=742152 RepID=A0A2H3K5Z1_WOLCO|nr:hypothetical protein WOLCODRAFT_164777 [Wolfiporia cocos MD-104 SS10]